MTDSSYSPSTEELVRRAQEGDREASEELISRYQPRLEFFINSRINSKLKPKVEPEDANQEAWLQAFKSLHNFTYQGKNSFFNWLCGISENVIRNKIRGLKPTVSIDPGSADGMKLGEILEYKALSPHRIFRRKERVLRFKDALSKLPEDYREIIILKLIQQLSSKEIAERLDRSVDAVYMLSFRAIKQFKTIFGSTESFGLASWPQDSYEPKSENSTGGSV